MGTESKGKLLGLVRKLTDSDGVHVTQIPALTFARSTKPTKLVSLVFNPSLCLVVQGAKEVLLVDETYRYDAAHSLLVSAELPVEVRVVEASPKYPYLGLRIALSSAIVCELLAEGASVPLVIPSTRAIAVTPIETPIIEAVTRLVKLLSTPEDVNALAPLVLREITYRLLTGPQGGKLRQIATTGAPAYRIAEAIRWLIKHFAETLSIESLANHVRMGVSAFHLHFKTVTGLSPLQYQKRLRLHEARRIMLNEGLDAMKASLQVGYESASQFGREYRRMFGESPSRDIAILKAKSKST